MLKNRLNLNMQNEQRNVLSHKREWQVNTQRQYWVTLVRRPVLDNGADVHMSVRICIKKTLERVFYYYIAHMCKKTVDNVKCMIYNRVELKLIVINILN